MYWFLLGFWKYQTLSETFLVFWAKALFCQSGNLLEGKTFPRKIFLCLFLVQFRQKIFTHRTKTFRQSSGIWVLRVQKKVFEEKIPGKKFLSTLVLSISGKFSDFQHFFFDMLFTNFIYHFQSSMSVAKNVWEEKEFCIFFLNFERNSFALWTKLLRQFPQNCILCMQRSLWMILFVKNLTFRIHSVYERKKTVLRGKKFSSLLKIALCVYWSLFSNFHPVFCGFWKYQKLSEIFLVFLAKAPFCQSGKLLEGKTFPRKIFFCLFLVHFRQKIFTHRTKTFRQSPGIWVLRVQKKVFEEKNPGKKLISALILSISGKFSNI